VLKARLAHAGFDFTGGRNARFYLLQIDGVTGWQKGGANGSGGGGDQGGNFHAGSGQLRLQFTLIENCFHNIGTRLFTDVLMQHLDPRAAHALLEENSQAILLDCRSETEHMYVGHPAGAEHVAWQDGPDWEIDPEFASKVKRLVKGDLSRPLLIICRSGRRSVDAGEALEAAGFSNVINVLDGFEGQLDDNYHRGTLGGWRFHGLPWFQS
jgi:rhodanese-related sulfurtransferase